MRKVAPTLSAESKTIGIVRFARTPEPDTLGVQPKDLPYDES